MTADVTSARSSPGPDACPDCDTSASVTSDLHKYQVACTCKPTAQYARAADPGAPPPKTDVPPALPPRPAAALAPTNRRNNAAVGCPAPDITSKRRKYAWWCVGCGALAAALGGLLAAQHILLRAYTASPHHLETVPAAVPAAMLVLTGVCIMSLARRRNRYSYMIKVVGACCLVCALTCVLVTITTTVIHMNKLQTLKFCSYTSLARTCTCFSVPPDAPHAADEDLRCVFEGVSDCGVVHGALYWCLRGVFALSVTAVLVCIFSSMLAYQLLSHERKKMYWEQLELRCRSLYRAPSHAPQQRPPPTACSCCSQCHPAQPQWDMGMQHRFWAPGRIGNLYSPNPGVGRKASAWSWFPWARSNSQNSRSCRTGPPPSGDSAYGFCETDAPHPHPHPHPHGHGHGHGAPAGTEPSPYETPSYPARGYPPVFQQQGYQGPASFAPTQASYQDGGFGESSGSYDASTGVWGPPPPYSPQGRGGSRTHLHHQDPAAASLLHHGDVRASMHLEHRAPALQTLPAHHQRTCRNSAYISHLLPNELAHLNPELARLNPELARLNPELARLNPELARLNPELARLNPELARLNPNLYHGMAMEEGRFNTLRGHLVQYQCQRALGMSLGNLHRDCRMPDETMTVECTHQKSASKVSDQSSDSGPKQGKENPAFQSDKHTAIRASAADCRRALADSEVYFADVSSCCNISLKADCCANPTVSALVGTIENHPESTSESENSLTLTRQQRPQPQTLGSKRRPRANDRCDRMKDVNVNSSVRLTAQQIDQLNNSLRINDSRLSDRMNDTRLSDRMNDSRLSDRMNECRMSERMNESRISDRMSESRISERHNESRGECRMNECRMNDRLNDSRASDCRLSERLNESRASDCRMNETRINDPRFIDRMNDTRMSDRFNESRAERMNDFARVSDGERRHSDHKVETIKCSPKRAHISPLRLKPSPRSSPLHPRQSSSDSNKSSLKPEFFIPPPPTHSPITPEEPADEEGERDKPEVKSLPPDRHYEPKEEKEPLKAHHQHCYSDTNTMDSGWQSGSDRQAAD